MTVPIVTYWQPKPGAIEMPAFYQLCWETIARHNPDARLMTRESVLDLGGQEPLTAAAGLPVAIESDLVRAWLLWQFGGVWLDLDSICFQPIAPALPPAAMEADLTCVRNPRTRGWSNRLTVASPYAARAGSPAAESVYRAALHHARRMRAGQHVPWGTTSCGVLSQTARRPDVRVHWLHPLRWHPIPSGHARRAFLRRGSRASHVAKFHPSTVAIHLSNPIPDACRDRTREQILTSNRYVSHLLQVALGLGPAIAPRTRSILARVPIGPSSGVEVGVFQARNAVQLLQQRPNLRMLLVDGYGDHESTYRSTADYQAQFSCERWSQIKRQAAACVRWAGDRVTWDHRPSVQAAAAIPDRSVDWVFIDADHSEPAVASDLAAWLPKIRPGGWIGGHDYCHPRANRRAYGVDAAVDCWAAFTGAVITRGDDTTWFGQV